MHEALARNSNIYSPPFYASAYSMNSNDPEPDAYRIVRRYSIQVSEDLPNNELAQGLRRYEESTQALEKEKDVEVHEWQRWLLFEGTEA